MNDAAEEGIVDRVWRLRYEDDTWHRKYAGYAVDINPPNTLFISPNRLRDLKQQSTISDWAFNGGQKPMFRGMKIVIVSGFDDYVHVCYVPGAASSD